ncbi:MAG TPA: COX15/CtaA family protein [Bryobacteraceae bacterium]|nr:COX15/CtaA family protein [Bryobacteraceae bacterium]
MAVLAYNIPVILWGAYVRISFSGDGCGANWPFCNGQVIPHHMAAPMAIEFTHRTMTSLDTFATLAMAIWAFLAFPKRHAVRRYSVLSLVFLFIEAMLGAGLVLFRLVARDQSAGRAWYLSAHLANTLLLLAALAATAWLAYTNSGRLRWANISRKTWAALAITLLVSITGAIAALGDTLFPASSLAAGVQQDLSSTTGMLLRLRMLHPAVAILGAAYLLWIAVQMLKSESPAPLRAAAKRVTAIVLLQLAVGVINVALLAPVWMQLVHLFIADLVWIAVVLMALESADAREIIPLGRVILPNSLQTNAQTILHPQE